MPILKEHKELLLAKSESKTLPEWYDYFGGQYTKKSIYSYCYRNKVKIKKISPEDKSAIQSANARKYSINQDYFKTWSRNMAYVFGFWCADGCIYNGKMFDITLHKKDKYILKQIAKELEYEGKLYDEVDKQSCRINFSCVVIYNDLVALGGSERKSFTLEFPSVPEEYLADFIRGYFDGDGCVMNIKGGRLNTAFTCASKKFLKQLHKILIEYAGVEGGSYDDASYSLRFGDRDSRRIGDFMYKNNPELFLSRKKNKFL